MNRRILLSSLISIPFFGFSKKENKTQFQVRDRFEYKRGLGTITQVTAYEFLSDWYKQYLSKAWDKRYPDWKNDPIYLTDLDRHKFIKTWLTHQEIRKI